MLTGSPLDLTPFGDLLGWIGNTIVFVWLAAAVWLAVSRAAREHTPREKRIAASKVLAVMIGIPMVLLGWQAYGAWREREAFRARYAVAEALFKKRCETAGEFIYKTVPDVKGVVWMKWRPKEVNHGDQFAMNDPYGRDCGGEDCIKGLLRSTFVVPNHDMNKPRLPDNGYEFVETTDPRDRKMYRYIAGVMALSQRAAKDRVTSTKNNAGVDPGEYVFGYGIERHLIEKYSARYGIAWDDISTLEDRENWIAGGSLTVADLQTNEVIARSVGYMMDPALGNTEGFRSPWDYASSHRRCQSLTNPSYRHYQWHETEASDFAFKALQPTKGEAK